LTHNGGGCSLPLWETGSTSSAYLHLQRLLIGKRIATGGFVTAIIGVYERWQKKSLSWQLYVFIIVSFCLYAVFAAWQDEHRNTAIVITEKSSYSSRFNECAVDLRSVRSTLRDKESLADSLQRGIVALAGPQAQQAANIASCINNLAKNESTDS